MTLSPSRRSQYQSQFARLGRHHQYSLSLNGNLTAYPLPHLPRGRVKLGMVRSVHSQCSGVPLAVGKIRGVRSFTIKDNGDLAPATFTESKFVWKPGENVCHCNNTYAYQHFRDENGRIIPHMSAEWIRRWETVDRNKICDDPEHSCGLWAYYDGTAYMRAPWTTSGIIEGYGRCEVGPRGFRASRADLLAIVCRDRLLLAFYVLVIMGWVCSLLVGSWWSVILTSLSSAALGFVFVTAREGMSGLNYRVLHRIRKKYRKTGVRIYSTRWWMLRRWPVEKVRPEWDGHIPRPPHEGRG